MDILSWIILGLIAGALAKLIMPGKDGGGLIATIILGMIGAFVGGWLARYFGYGDVGYSWRNIHNIIGATIGAIIVLFLYRLLKSRG